MAARNPSNPECLLLRIEEAARLLNLSRSHVYTLVQGGVIPSIRIGRAVRIPKAWVQSWVLERTAAWEKAHAEYEKATPV
jgi:excisionase family DNA binding protein